MRGGVLVYQSVGLSTHSRLKLSFTVTGAESTWEIKPKVLIWRISATVWKLDREIWVSCAGLGRRRKEGSIESLELNKPEWIKACFCYIFNALPAEAVSSPASLLALVGCHGPSLLPLTAPHTLSGFHQRLSPCHLLHILIWNKNQECGSRLIYIHSWLGFTN